MWRSAPLVFWSQQTHFNGLFVAIKEVVSRQQRPPRALCGCCEWCWHLSYWLSTISGCWSLVDKFCAIDVHEVWGRCWRLPCEALKLWLSWQDPLPLREQPAEVLLCWSSTKRPVDVASNRNLSILWAPSNGWWFAGTIIVPSKVPGVVRDPGVCGCTPGFMPKLDRVQP